jgi:hypothetical protein
MPRTTSPGLTIAQLEALLQGRRTELFRLEKQRGKVARKLAQLDAKINALGGGRGRTGGGGGRVQNKMSLNDMIISILGKTGKPMAVGDIESAVRNGGYRTNSANFRGIVNQSLIKDKRFTSAGRGLYQLKK